MCVYVYVCVCVLQTQPWSMILYAPGLGRTASEKNDTLIFTMVGEGGGFPWRSPVASTKYLHYLSANCLTSLYYLL